MPMRQWEEVQELLRSEYVALRDAGLYYAFRAAIWIGGLLVVFGGIDRNYQGLAVAGAVLAGCGMIACAIEEKTKV
jgi:hypothetical protein